MFRKLRGIKIPYARQGVIYFTCRNYFDEPPEVQRKINRLCAEVAGKQSGALLEMLVYNRSVRQTAIRYFCDEATLYRRRKKFFESW